MSHWQEVALSEVTECLDSKRVPVKESERIEGDVPYYGANGQQGWIDRPIFNEPLVLVAEDGGHFEDPSKGVAYKINGPSWVNNHAHVLRPLGEHLDVDFLRRVLENYDFGKYISGSTRSKLNQKQLNSATIPLPPLEEQRRIAAILDKADELRTKRREAITKLDTLAQSIFIDMFGDPVTNPMGWDIPTLEEVTNKITDGKHGDCRPDPESGYYFVSVKDISDGKIVYDGARQIMVEDYHAVQKRVQLEPQDVLITNSGTIGRTAIIPDDPIVAKTTFQKSVAIVKPRMDSVSPQFLKSVLDFNVKVLSRTSSGSGQKNLLLGQLRRFKIPLPPLALQRQYSAIVESVEHKRLDLNQATSIVDTLFSSLQQRAFKGEL